MTDLHAMLQNRGIENLIVCGVTTEVCVNTTVREGNDRGWTEELAHAKAFVESGTARADTGS